ncbi:MAG TPA: peptidoglycan bridge formation glycyltransferase FemA/FemB family protein [Anaerolineales bacterium]|nr:peptidoglycan bridge formation glycyltransferase FemA/FemB family protein [Anaerolineales bacterium]
MPLFSSSEWEIRIQEFPSAHILQTRPWGDLKQDFGWRISRVGIFPDGDVSGIGAQILFKPLPFGLSLAYIPRGPVGLSSRAEDHPLWQQWLDEVDLECKKQHAIFLKIEPDLWESEANPNALPEVDNIPDGFKLSEQDIQPARTLLVDIRGEEEAVLSRMKQKTRYNIRLAQKKGVIVKESHDLSTFYNLMELTGQRDQFGVHSLAYYQRAYDLFHPSDACQIFIAEFESEPLAAVMVFFHGTRAWYFYGASSEKHRELMPAYLLQWRAMRWAREKGCTYYDLWGVPDHNLQDLEAGFMAHSAGLWGVYRFKRGFGGELKRTQGPWDRVYRKFWYWLYLSWMKMRASGNEI